MPHLDPLDADIAESQVTLGDLLQPALRHRSHVLLITIVVTTIAALAAGAMYVRQARTRTATLSFRLLFPGAAYGTYPNGQPFIPTDIIGADVVDPVSDQNNIAHVCSPDAFRSGLVVLARSAELTALDAAFESRVADPRLTAADRQRVTDEYASRRTTTPTAYDLNYVDPPACVDLPDVVLTKALPGILETWAARTQQVSGVTRFDTPVLTPAVFDDDGTAGSDPLIRADLLRTRVARVVANIRIIEALPGAAQSRASESHLTLAEVRGRLEDLMKTRLDPLIAGVGRNPQSRAWIEQALDTAKAEATATDRRAEIYYTALDEYARSPMPMPPIATLTPKRADGVPATDVERALVDRIVSLSAASTEFRKELTRQAVNASLEAVERHAAVTRYQTLLAGPSGGSAGQLAPEATITLLADILAAAKRETTHFNEIYAELSRVALRVGGNLYRIEQPLEVGTARAVTVGRLLEGVVGVMVVTPIVLALGLLFYSHGRHVLGAARSATLRK
jgi:hypothetical protein